MDEIEDISMQKKIIIAVAPTGGWGKDKNNPLTPDEISEDVAACCNEGASIVHLHARDLDGNLTTDLLHLSKTTEKIRKACNIIIEASTGGLSNLTREQRALPLTNKEAVIGSLNMGSLNFGDDVYINSAKDIRYWIDEMNKNSVKPSMEIFDTSQLIFAKHLIEQDLIKSQYNFNFIFNCKWCMWFSKPLLDALIAFLPGKSIWGALFAQNTDFKFHLQAALSGASFVRVGFEDSQVCNNSNAKKNWELVKTLRTELEVLGFRIANPNEANKIMDISI